jgi:hypothetical protein
MVSLQSRLGIQPATGLGSKPWRVPAGSLREQLSRHAERVDHVPRLRLQRRRRWKRYFKGSSGYGHQGDNAERRFYDLDSDPAEKKDLKDTPSERFSEMRKAFDAWESQQSKP